VDKCVELPSEECEMRKKLTTIGRNLRDLRISPHHTFPQTESESIQNTPTEYQGRLPRESAPARLSRLSSVYFPRDLRASGGGSTMSENPEDGDDETLSNIERKRSFPILQSHFSANSEVSNNGESI
jgi:hypothetical protein